MRDAPLVGGSASWWRSWRVILLCVVPVVLGVVLVREVLDAPSPEKPAPGVEEAGKVLHTFDYDAVRPSRDLAGADGIWQGEQEPRVDGKRRHDRIRVVPADEAPAGEGRPPGNVMRVELRPYADGDGDVTTTDDYRANRSEVFGRQPEESGTPAAEWPDPEGATRWYSFSVYLEDPWEFTTKGGRWLTLTQWKGARTGRPPVALELAKDEWRLGGKGGSDSLGEAATGVWTRFDIGLHFSPDPDVGWAEVWIDGEQVMPRSHRATLRSDDGDTDPAYLKQGIYRSRDWTSTHVAYFGSLTIGTTRDSVT